MAMQSSGAEGDAPSSRDSDGEDRTQQSNDIEEFYPNRYVRPHEQEDGTGDFHPTIPIEELCLESDQRRWITKINKFTSNPSALIVTFNHSD